MAFADARLPGSGRLVTLYRSRRVEYNGMTFP